MKQIHRHRCWGHRKGREERNCAGPLPLAVYRRELLTDSLSSTWMLSSQSWHVGGTVLPFNIQGEVLIQVGDDTSCTNLPELLAHTQSTAAALKVAGVSASWPYLFSPAAEGSVGQLKWCILVNICWPRISCWQTCRQADTEASLLGCQGCDTTAGTSLESWLPQLLLGASVSHWRRSLETLCQMPSMLLPGLCWWWSQDAVPPAHTSDHRARLHFHLSPNSSISILILLQEF